MYADCVTRSKTLFGVASNVPHPLRCVVHVAAGNAHLIWYIMAVYCLSTLFEKRVYSIFDISLRNLNLFS